MRLEILSLLVRNGMPYADAVVVSNKETHAMTRHLMDMQRAEARADQAAFAKASALYDKARSRCLKRWFSCPVDAA